MKLDCHFQGKLTELLVAEKLIASGYQVSQPLVNSSRYDFIVDIKNNLYRIQVKTAHTDKDKNYFEFATSSSHTNTNGTVNRSYKADEIDYFATIYENQCYLIPVNLCGSRTQRLRLKPTINNQTKGVAFATDYLLKNIFPND